MSALGVEARTGDDGSLPLLLDDSLESLLESDVPSVPLVVSPSLVEELSVVDVSGLDVPSVSLATLLSAGGTSGTVSSSPSVYKNNHCSECIPIVNSQPTESQSQVITITPKSQL